MLITELLKSTISKNCISAERQTNPVKYWSEVIFAKCVYYAAPLSLIAIVPGIIITLQLDKILILWLNIISFLTMLFVGYFPKINVAFRKITMMALIYFAAFVLLKEMGNFGPGLVYLMSVHVLILVLFPEIKAGVPFLFTLTFCIIYGLLIHLKLVNVSSDKNINVFEWAAISGNVLFLGALFSMIIPFLFSKIRALLEEKNQLLQSEKEINKSLQKAIEIIKNKNTELDQFAFIASHDLQEPLRTISSFIDKLKGKYNHYQEEKTLKYMYFISEGATRLKNIVADLLDYSRIENSHSGWQYINVNDIITNYRVLRTKLVEEKSAEIKCINLPTIRAPKVPLTQTLHSLLDNAIKFAKKGQPSIVEIKAEEKEYFWQFQIKDNGIGIDPQFFDKIFMLFQKLHNRDQYPGSGIGLPVAKKNIELIGGNIWLDSQPGEGTTFFFTIPSLKNIS